MSGNREGMKLYYQALKALPNEFVDDNTRATLWEKDMVVAANPSLAPIKYEKSKGKWEQIKLSEVPPIPQAEVI